MESLSSARLVATSGMAFGLTAYRVGHADGTRSMANDQVPGDAAQGKNTHHISQDRIVMLTTFVSYNPVSSGNAHASAANPGLAVQDPTAAPVAQVPGAQDAAAVDPDAAMADFYRWPQRMSAGFKKAVRFLVRCLSGIILRCFCLEAASVHIMHSSCAVVFARPRHTNIRCFYRSASVSSTRIG